MDRKLGIVFGALAAVVTIVVGVRQGVPAGETVLRAAIAFALGFTVGWLVFGRLGASVMKEAAGHDAEKDGKGPK